MSREGDRRACWALVGKLKAGGLPGELIKTDIARRITNGRTESTKAVSDDEMSRLRLELADACRSAGIDPRGDNATPARAARPRRAVHSAGVPGLRSPQQANAIRQLAARNGRDDDAIAQLLKTSPSSRQAAATIERLKSQLVRSESLLLRLYALRRVAAWSTLTSQQRALCDDLLDKGFAGGRAINRLPVGGVLWALDILRGVTK